MGGGGGCGTLVMNDIIFSIDSCKTYVCSHPHLSLRPPFCLCVCFGPSLSHCVGGVLDGRFVALPFMCRRVGYCFACSCFGWQRDRRTRKCWVFVVLGEVEKGKGGLYQVCCVAKAVSPFLAVGTWSGELASRVRDWLIVGTISKGYVACCGLINGAEVEETTRACDLKRSRLSSPSLQYDDCRRRSNDQFKQASHNSNGSIFQKGP